MGIPRFLYSSKIIISVGIDGKKRKNWQSHELEQKIAHKRSICCAALKELIGVQ